MLLYIIIFSYWMKHSPGFPILFHWTTYIILYQYHTDMVTNFLSILWTLVSQVCPHWFSFSYLSGLFSSNMHLFFYINIRIILFSSKKRKRKHHYSGNSKEKCKKCINFGITNICVIYFYFVSFTAKDTIFSPLGNLLILRKGIFSFHFQVLVFIT